MSLDSVTEGSYNTSRIKNLVFNLNMDRIVVPVRAKTYYRYAEFFFTHTAIGTAILKKARFAIQDIKIRSNNPELEDRAKKMIRVIKLREKIVKTCRDYDIYGISAVFPMYAIDKVIVCESCGDTYLLKDLTHTGDPEYKWDSSGEGSIQYKCRNKKCSAYGKNASFKMRDRKDSSNLKRMSIAVWSPNNIEAVYNKITDTKQYKLYIDKEMRNLIRRGDHYILCTTPQIYIRAALKNRRIVINPSKLFIFEAPTMNIQGMPIPPMVMAFQDLYTRMKYVQANANVAEELMVPFRMLYPIWRGESGGHLPRTQTINSLTWRQSVLSQYKKWKKDNKHVMVMPIEMGSKDFWGAGKLLVLGRELRENMSDILATIGVPIEFIFGGVTWSRQNVSAIILENTFKQFGMLVQELLDFIAEKINSSQNVKDKVELTLEMPRLVEALAESTFLEKGMVNGDISPELYYSRFGVDLRAQRSKIEATKQDRIYFKKMQKRLEAQGEVEFQEVLLSGQKKIKETERREALKDQLSIAAIESDKMEAAIDKHKKLMKMDIASKKKLLDYQLDVQNKRRINEMDGSLEHMKESLKIQSDQQYRDAKRSMKLELNQMEAMGLKGDEVNYKRQMAEEYRQLMEIYKKLPKTKQLELIGMKYDDRKKCLQEIAIEQEMSAINDNLDPQTKQELSQLSEEERNKQLENIYKKKKDEEQIEKTVTMDPNLQKERIKRMDEERAEDQSINLSATTYNRLNQDEREYFKQQLMQESSERFAKVKETADAMATMGYADRLANADDNEISDIVEEIEAHRPDIAKDVETELESRMFIKQQAAAYASRMIKLEGTPEFGKFVKEVQKFPDEFKQMISDNLDQFMKIEKDNTLIKTGEDDVAKEMALQIQESYNETDRVEMLKQLRYINPTLYKKIIANMDLDK